VDLQAREVRHSTWKYGVKDLVRDLGGRSLWQRARIPAAVAGGAAFVIAAVLVLGGGGESAPPAAGQDCTLPDGVTIEEATTSPCFGVAVAEAFRGAGGPSELEGVYSEAAKAEFDLECTSGDPAVCTVVASTAPGWDKSSAGQVTIDR
jgi:hypothetical protein